MEIEILRLVHNYSLKRKLADNEFVDKIIEIVVSKKSLNDYVRNVIFINKLRKDCTAEYDDLSKEILVYFPSIQINLDHMSRSYNTLFTDFEQIMFRNLIVAEIILHELEHALQARQADNELDISIEANLMRESFEFAKIIGRKINNSSNSYDLFRARSLHAYYYYLDPAERLADINAFKTILLAIEPIKKRVSNLYEFEKASFVEAQLKGYQISWERGSCPTQVFLNGFSGFYMWYKLDFYDYNDRQLLENVKSRYDLEKRLSLGLPITRHEFKEKNEWLQSTNKFSI